MKLLKSLLLILVGVILTALFAYSYLGFSPKKKTFNDSTTVVNEVNKVLKLATVESHLSEILEHKQYYNFDIAPLRKKMLIRVNATVLIGYDLEKINLSVDELKREIYIDKLPEPELLSIDHKVDFYDIKEGLFTSFSTFDFNNINKLARAKIEEAVYASDFFDEVDVHENELIETLGFIVKGMGWNLRINTQNNPKNIY